MAEDKKGTIIFYENQYWLCDYYDTEIKGFFGYPVYITGEEVEVRPAGGNWIFDVWNYQIASIQKSLKIDIFKSWISRLNWNINFCKSNQSALIGVIEKWKLEILYFDNLISGCL